MYVRRAEPGDRSKLNELCLKIFPGPLPPPLDSYFILVKHDIFLGLASLIDHGILPQAKDTHSFELQNFGILPSERKIGNGNFLFQQICSQLPEHSRIEWLTAKGTIGFWKKVTKHKAKYLVICAGCETETCEFCHPRVDSPEIYHIEWISHEDCSHFVVFNLDKQE